MDLILVCFVFFPRTQIKTLRQIGGSFIIHENGGVGVTTSCVCVSVQPDSGFEPRVTGWSTSDLCSISSRCVIARLDMCLVQITEKRLGL